MGIVPSLGAIIIVCVSVAAIAYLFHRLNNRSSEGSSVITTTERAKKIYEDVGSSNSEPNSIELQNNCTYGF